MEAYWKGGVSALISPGEPSKITNDKDDSVSTRVIQKSKVKTDRGHSGNGLDKSSKPASIDNEFSNKQDRKKRKKKNKISPNSEDVSSAENVSPSKKRKLLADESEAIENDTANMLSDDVNQPVNVTKNSEALTGKSTKTKKGNKSRPSRNKIVDDGVDKSDRTIFVGNLPLTYDHKKVVKIFSKFGEVESARIRCVPVPRENFRKKTSAIMKKFHPNRNSAVAYVVFKSSDSVPKAVAQNGMILNEHHLRIDSAVSQKRDTKKSVFVGGLPFDIKDDELWDLFKDCGEIEDVRVIRDQKVSMGKGFGYVNFKSCASVELALKLNGQELKNRKINVERCTQKKKKNIPKTSFVHEKKKKRRRDDKQQAGMPKSKQKKNQVPFDFQGRKAEQKSKKKKKGLSRDAARKKQIQSVFVPSSEKMKRKKLKN